MKTLFCPYRKSVRVRVRQQEWLLFPPYLSSTSGSAEKCDNNKSEKVSETPLSFSFSLGVVFRTVHFPDLCSFIRSCKYTWACAGTCPSEIFPPEFSFSVTKRYGLDKLSMNRLFVSFQTKSYIKLPYNIDRENYIYTGNRAWKQRKLSSVMSSNDLVLSRLY